MEFTPFVCYLIFVIIIFIPFRLFYLRNRILNGKFSLIFYIILTLLHFGSEAYFSYLIYKKQEDDRKHAWMLVGGLIGVEILFGITIIYKIS
jgi:hypothetical protein